MPKKFVGENSKAAAARARKTAAKEEENARRQQQLEDELWKDDDKHIIRKQQRKEEQLRKKQAVLEKKAESKALLEQELKTIQTTNKQPAAKITQAQIQAETERRRLAALKIKEPETHLQVPLEENINRVVVEGDEARNIDEAIAVLSDKTSVGDKHPEKRLKAAYTEFEEANLPRIKMENPTLRLSQLKQILRKEWMKSPQNPLNQRLMS
ncbi:coiled-coil domain-containing protein 124 [Schistocerca americana]|uniref:coiled-coil domain-containing protein 124 n=1 Tax=Schistocerca americana TaxID=7009 RepID=UPI001F4FB207|nr:coiled-coil domain-containing protein 124 [Schistocerca americana]XP_046999877.1 coiled-coil domain-containing protein 124 [Schistocerca americana]XP_046999878.1 coiled-coil domain-containing protein 124 [Schistocerca americana]XP_049963008.1 coiled-coil domain-containing protein 124 [Schistocerca serialis cubense]XP_049963009.1 coiled-coil domain-containing protein 124 [Schistocerca serialis cubense]